MVFATQVTSKIKTGLRRIKRLKIVDSLALDRLRRPLDGFGAAGLIHSSIPLSQGDNTINDIESLENAQVLTRFCEIESPYWASFLTHYLKLGVKIFHVCIQFDEEIKLAEQIANMLGTEVVTHKINPATDPGKALRQMDLSVLSEGAAFTLMVDSDEYFHAPRRALTLQRLFNIYPTASQISIPWLISPILDYDRSPRIQGFWGHIGKPACRTALIKGLYNDHEFRMARSGFSDQGKIVPVGPHGVAIAHFWSRTFRDCLLKTFNNRFINSKTSDLHSALDIIRMGDLPVRLRLLAYLSSQSCYMPSLKPNYEMFDSQLEEQLLRRSLPERDEALCLEIFEEYRALMTRLACQLPLYPALSLQELACLLPSVTDLRSIP